MKVTIDSSEALADTLRVIGAVYNVTLAQVHETTGAAKPDGSVSAPSPSPKSDRKQTRQSRTQKPTRTPATRTRQRPAPKATAAAAADIRAWANANGHPVNDRGPLSATVRAAYAADLAR